MQSVNLVVGIIDDIELVGVTMRDALMRTSANYGSRLGIHVQPLFPKLDTTSPEAIAASIERFLLAHPSLDYLLLDRNYFNILNQYGTHSPELPTDRLVVAKGSASISLENCLQHVDFSHWKTPRGLILYTYDDPDVGSQYYVLPDAIKSSLAHALGGRLSPPQIEVILTCSDYYRHARIDLYMGRHEAIIGQREVLGRKSAFALYGLILAEVIYLKLLALEVERLR